MIKIYIFLVVILFYFFHVLSAVTKEGANQAFLQHGEGRPENPQQRGGGGDGMPLSFVFTSTLLLFFPPTVVVQKFSKSY